MYVVDDIICVSVTDVHIHTCIYVIMHVAIAFHLFCFCSGGVCVILQLTSLRMYCLWLLSLILLATPLAGNSFVDVSRALHTYCSLPKDGRMSILGTSFLPPSRLSSNAQITNSGHCHCGGTGIQCSQTRESTHFASHH